VDGVVNDVNKLFSAAWALVSVIFMVTFALVAVVLQVIIRIAIQLIEWTAYPFACLYTYLKTYGNIPTGQDHAA
jgi:hypothetical protein